MRAMLALLIAISGVGFAQDFSLSGAVGLDTSVRLRSIGGYASVDVPVVVRARVEIGTAIGPDASFRTVLLPAFGSGTQPDEPLATIGPQEAYLEIGSGSMDLSAGYQRLPLTQMRLVEPVSIEPRLETGEHRGPLTARALIYSGAWRARTALIGVTGNDLVPEGPGVVASLRYESAALTVESQALWTVRPAVGVTASGSAGPLVVYGEAWLLADPWEGRGGGGVTGYLGEWLWTTEAAWAPVDGNLRSPGAPVVAASVSRPLGLSGSVDATVVAAWPTSPVDPQQSSSRRGTQLDAAVAFRHDQGNSSLSIVPAFRLSESVWAGSLGLSLRAYY